MATTRKSAEKRKSTARRDASSDGRRRRVTASLPTSRTLSIGAAVVGAGAVLAGAFAWFRGRPLTVPSILTPSPSEGHAVPDLEGDKHPDGSERAVEAFRPDMDAPMTAAEREALRPPVGKPSLVN